MPNTTITAKAVLKWAVISSLLSIMGIICLAVLFLCFELGVFHKNHHNSSDLVGREIAAIYLDHHPHPLFSRWRKYTEPEVIDVVERGLDKLHTWPTNAPGTSCRRMSSYYNVYVEFVDGGSVKGTTRFYTCPPGFTFQRTVHDPVESPLDFAEPVPDSVQEFLKNVINANPY